MENLRVERTKNKDLAALKDFGGPFTSSAEVDKFLKLKRTREPAKVERLYLAIRYARNTSLVFPKKSEVFSLKRGNKNLTSAEYGKNLKTYMNKFSTDNVATMRDFSAVLDQVLVLSEGKIEEAGAPCYLLANKKSIFYGMAVDAGLA
ncbi:hypothetical protein GQR58_013414 [Nymphon striatum]|nr:hypothetical protein GQR58_013414 [Nymphon striatum]